MKFQDFTFNRLLKDAVNSASTFYKFEFRKFDADLEDYIKRQFEPVYLNLAIACIIGGIFYHLMGMAIEPQIEELRLYLDILQLFHLTCIFLYVASIIFFRYMSSKLLRISVLFNFLVCNVGVGIVCRKMLVEHVHYTYVDVYIFLYQTVVSILLFVMVPFEKILPNLFYALYCWCSNFLILRGLPGLQVGMILCTVIYGIAVIVKSMILTIINSRVIGEYFAQKMLIAAQQALRDRDLELARGIQDSLAPPEYLQWHGVNVRYLCRKHSAVGGGLGCCACRCRRRFGVGNRGCHG